MVAAVNSKEQTVKVLVLGGDGFCGWPTSLNLSDNDHDVTIVDNLSRREIDLELEVDSLTPIRPIGERIRVWKELTGKQIDFVHLDLAEESTTASRAFCASFVPTPSC